MAFSNDLGANRRERRITMRFIKMFGFAPTAAVALMALVGATSASAANTELCTVQTALTCGAGNDANSISMNNAHDGVGTLLNDLADVLCLNVSGSAEALALADPQKIHVTALSFESCGTTSSHTNCDVEVNELPLAHLSKTGLNTGYLLGLSGKVFVGCEDVWLGEDIECEYNVTGVTVTIGAQHATAFETGISEIGSDFLCPNNPTLDGLLHTTANRYVLA
jgi:hypothetical protein